MSKNLRFFPKVRTKNHSAIILRSKVNGLAPQKVRSIVRLGSTTSTETVYPKSFGKRPIIEVNTVEAIQNSRSKLKMKTCFKKAEVNQADWFIFSGDTIINQNNEEVLTKNLPFPIIAKRIYGFKGKGMLKLDTAEDFNEWYKNLTVVSREGYYLEKFYSYLREYRLHCTETGCFYTCRKMLKQDAEIRWMRNDSNCVWILEENPEFDKPNNWKTIEAQCIKALKAVGLTIGAFDVKVQGKDKDNPDFIIIEVNSAPAFGEITKVKYTEAINNLISTKIQKEYA